MQSSGVNSQSKEGGGTAVVYKQFSYILVLLGIYTAIPPLPFEPLLTPGEQIHQFLMVIAAARNFVTFDVLEQ